MCKLKNPSFSYKLEILLPFTISGGVFGISLLFKKVFRIDQYAFGIVKGSPSLLLNFLVYLYLALSIVFEHSFELV